MARSPRVEAAGGVHHVTGRCTDGIRALGEPASCRSFLALLATTTGECEWVVYAYCLMPNHFHILLRTPEPNLGDGMRRVKGLFAQRFNRRACRRGALWAERFHSRLVVDETHALLTAAYIPLNPVRAGIVDSPAAWRWSSFRATAGLERAPAFLANAELLQWFGSEIDLARTRYRRWIEETAAQLTAARRVSPGTVPDASWGTVPGASPV